MYCFIHFFSLFIVDSIVQTRTMSAHVNGRSMTTDDRLKQAYEILSKRNRNRALNIKDAGTVIRAAGYSPTNSELKKIIDTKLGTIYAHQLFDLKTIQDLCNGLKKRSEKDVHDSLRCFDYERNGFISAQELKYFLSTRGEKLSEEEIDEMLRDMDIDEQGMLSIEQALSVLFVGDYTE
jgi:Ca2+-binding EF-hand superfamily protein